jgi:hypothetical protein
VQHIKIYLPCNFEVNPNTHFDRLWKLEKRGDEIKKKSSPLMAAITKNRNFFKWPKLLYFKPESAQI